MDRIGNRANHQYVLADGAAPEQLQAEPAPADQLDWQSVDPRHHGMAHAEPADVQLFPPTPSKGENHVVHEVRPAPRASSFDRTRHASEKYWLNEAASCLVAFGALVAIIGLLHRHDGQPLPEWRYGITLNALVSVLSTILKAAAVVPLAGGISQAKWLWYAKPRPLRDIETFDDASRGPWGSLLLLFDLRPHYLASLGAFLTVVALAVDPFTQQVLQTQECMRLDASAVARIPRANVYDRNGEKVAGTHGENSIYLPMAASIYSGLISPSANASALIAPVCPSGNCTFPETDGRSYQSLAMCHECEDITQLVKNRTRSASSLFNFTLPSGPYLATSLALSATTKNSTPIADDRVFNLEMVMYTNQSGPLALTGPPQDVRLLGARCGLFPCVKTYSAHISKHVLQEHELSSVKIPRDNQRMFTLALDQAIRNGTVRSCASAEDTAPARDGRASEWPAGDCTWYVTYQSSWSTETAISYNPLRIQNLRPLTEPTIRRLSQGPEYAMRLLLESLFEGKTLQYTISPMMASVGDPWLRNIYHNGAANLDTITQFMRGLADAITGQMRAEGHGGTAGWAEGIVLVDRTCVRVNWPWLAFPAALLVLVVGFLGLTVAATLRTRWREHGLDGEAAARVGFLKASPLALLFFGLHRDVLDDAGHPTTASRMQDVAQETPAALQWSWYEGQWRFVKAKPGS